MKRGVLAVDGASKGNPGPAGIGIVILDESGKVVCECGEYIGEATNNLAEYTALVKGLEKALSMGFENLTVRTDSELVARQLSGEYKVKSKNLLSLFNSVVDLLSKFKDVSVEQVARTENAQADRLASRAAERRKG